MRYDALVLGSGPAGFYFAKTYAQSGKKIAVIENSLMGGTGFRTGCLPVKKYLDTIRKVNVSKDLINKGFIDGTVDLSNVYKRTKDDLKKVEELIEEQLKNLNVDIYVGEGRFLSANQFEINKEILYADKIIIATGTSPCGFSNIEIDEKIILSHKGAINLELLPKELAIIGANVEGIEFASLFSSLGVNVTVVDMEDEILKGTDEDLKKLSVDYLKENNVKFILGKKVKDIYKNDHKVDIILDHDEVIKSDKVLITGVRKPNIPKGLQKIGVNVQEYIPVDQNFMTNIENIYAIGDINGILGMAHVAINQAINLSDYLVCKKEIMKNYKSLPNAIFTIVEIAGAGIQEEELKKNNRSYSVEKVFFKDTFRGFSKDIDKGFIKLMIDEEQKIIGIWISSEYASDLIGDVGLWIDQNLSVDHIKEKLFIHPTISEGLLDAALKF
ncbi:NAD(P)/FAD-dependent oxidoreductase [Lutibacter sp. B2]|nr:NAD(P)/FAD-dependent oxidoreductase [Lutibacter sp. B2]